MPTLRIGTRASPLARWQAEWVAAQLRQRGVEVSLVPIVTTGDQQPPLGTMTATKGIEQGIFTKEIQRALLDDRIDLAVHSLKDLPTVAVPGLTLAAVPERGPVGDVLVLREHREERSPKAVPPLPSPLSTLPSPFVVGTGSVRRRAQLLHVRPDLEVKDVRGNVETRLHKLEQGDFDALILAEAGLRRLGLDRHIAQVLPPQLVLPAVGQGALALETRTDDRATRQLVAALDHPPTHVAIAAEREMLSALQGGCLAPIAALACVEKDQLTLTGRVIGHDGVELLEASDRSPIVLTALSAAIHLGRRVAEALLAQGAAKLIEASRKP